MNDRVFGRNRCSKKLNNVFFEHNATKSDVHFGAAQRAKRAVVCLSRGGRNQPHTLKDTRRVPQVWGTLLFLENPAHDTGTISGDDNVFIKNQSSPRIVPVVFSFQVKHQRKSDRHETGTMHFWRFSGIMKSLCGLGLEYIQAGTIHRHDAPDAHFSKENATLLIKAFS